MMRVSGRSPRPNSVERLRMKVRRGRWIRPWYPVWSWDKHQRHGSPWKLVKNVGSQASLKICHIRICILERSPRYWFSFPSFRSTALEDLGEKKPTGWEPDCRGFQVKFLDFLLLTRESRMNSGCLIMCPQFSFQVHFLPLSYTFHLVSAKYIY